MFEYSIHIKSTIVPDGSFILCERNDLRTTILEEFRAVIAYISQTLYHHFFTLHACIKSKLLHYIRHIANFTKSEENTETCCFLMATYSSLCNRFTGNT